MYLPLQLQLGLGKSEVLFLEVSTLSFISKRGEDGRTGWVVNCSEVEDKLCVNGRREDWWRRRQFVGCCGISRGSHKHTDAQTMSPTVCKMSFWVKQELYYWLLAVFIDSAALLGAEVLWIRNAFQHWLFMLVNTCLNNMMGVFGSNPSAEILERFVVP
jgi:hypothetical protein